MMLLRLGKFFALLAAPSLFIDVNLFYATIFLTMQVTFSFFWQGCRRSAAST